MAHPDRLRPVHRTPLLLLAALISLLTLVVLGPTSELSSTRAAPAPAAVSGPATVPGPAGAAGHVTVPATTTLRPTAVTAGAVAPGDRVSWRDAVELLSPSGPAPVSAASGTTDSAYRLPLPDAVVRAVFDAPATPWARGHRGVDLEAVVGAEVVAPRGGVVRFAGTVVDRSVVTIEHADGLRSSLEPVLAAVEVGSRVRAGQMLGTVQARASHCRPLSCVHWGVREGTAYLDPLSLLPGSGPVVLLPVPQE